MILHLSLWYKKNKNLKKENRIMQRNIINLKYKILMRKHRMPISAKKKKTTKQGDDKQEVQAKEKEETYEDIQHLQSGGM